LVFEKRGNDKLGLEKERPSTLGKDENWEAGKKSAARAKGSLTSYYGAAHVQED